MSADDRRNVLLKDIESRMVICETLIEKLLKQQASNNDQVLQILSTIKTHTEQLHTVSHQLVSISELLVKILATKPNANTKITQHSMRV